MRVRFLHGGDGLLQEEASGRRSVPRWLIAGEGALLIPGRDWIASHG